VVNRPGPVETRYPAALGSADFWAGPPEAPLVPGLEEGRGRLAAVPPNPGALNHGAVGRVFLFGLPQRAYVPRERSRGKTLKRCLPYYPWARPEE